MTADQTGAVMRSQRLFLALNADARRLVDEVWQNEEVRGRVKENYDTTNFAQVVKIKEVLECIVLHFYSKIGNFEKEISRLNSHIQELKQTHHTQTRAHFKEMVNLKNQLRLLPSERLMWVEGQANTALVFFEPFTLLDDRTKELVRDVLTEKLSQTVALYPRVLSGADKAMNDNVDRLTRVNKELETQLEEFRTKCSKLESRIEVLTGGAQGRKLGSRKDGNKQTKLVTLDGDDHSQEIQKFLNFRYDGPNRRLKHELVLTSPIREFEMYQVSRSGVSISKSVNTDAIPATTSTSAPVAATGLPALQASNNITAMPAPVASNDTEWKFVPMELATPPRPTSATSLLPPRPTSAAPKITAHKDTETMQMEKAMEAMMQPLLEENSWCRDRLEAMEIESKENRSLIELLQERLRVMIEENGNLKKNKPLMKFSRPDTAPAQGQWRNTDTGPTETRISVAEASEIPYTVRSSWPQYIGNRRSLLYDDFLCIKERQRRATIAVAKKSEDVDLLDDADGTKSEGEVFDELDFLEQLRRRRRPSSSFFHRFLRGREVLYDRINPHPDQDPETAEESKRQRPRSCPPTLYHIRGGGWRLHRPASSSTASNWTRPTTGTSRPFSLARGARPQSRQRFFIRDQQTM